MKTSIGIGILALSCLASPVRVTVEGAVDAITADSLGMADSLGLAIGSPVRYELELDYAEQPTMTYNGFTQTWNDTTRDNGDSLDYFKVNLISGRMIPVRHAIAATLQGGVYVVSGPTHPQFALNSHLLGPINTYYSFGLYSQDSSSQLTESTQGHTTESFVLNNATVLVFSATISKITVHGPTALRSLFGRNPKGQWARIPGTSIYRFRGKVFTLDGRTR